MSEPMTSVPVPAAMLSVAEPTDPIEKLIYHLKTVERALEGAASEIECWRDRALAAEAALAEEKSICLTLAALVAGLETREEIDAWVFKLPQVKAALAGERERTVRDTLLHVRNLLAANQVPLGKDFEDVWNANARELYES